MPSRAIAIAAVCIGTVCAGACSTPETGGDDLATGRARVQDLIEDTLAELPETAEYVLADEPGEQTCRKTALGYAVGATGDHRAELPVVVDLPDGTDTLALLDDAEREWTEQGYEVTRPETADPRFPKVQARDDNGYRVTMTALTNIDIPRISIYAVSQCLAGS